MSDLRTDFTQLSDYLSKSVGADGLVDSLTKRSVLAPAVLSVLIVILSSCNGLVTFNLLFVTEFSRSLFSENMMLVAAALKIGGSICGLLIASQSGLKMLMLLGRNRKHVHND